MSSSMHRHTPSLVAIHPRGFCVRSIAYHRSPSEDVITTRIHRQVFNIMGQLSEQWDPRLFELNRDAPEVRPNLRTHSAFSGRALKTESVDAGWRVAFSNTTGQLRDRWDGRSTHHQHQYDELMRPCAVFEQRADGVHKRCVERFTYALVSPDDVKRNRCGRMIRHDDTAGSEFHTLYGLLNLPLVEMRRFCQMLITPDWPESVADRDTLLEVQSYTSNWRYNALGGVLEQTTAVGNSQSFNLDILGLTSASSLDGVKLLKSSQYNAFGLVESEHAGNDVVTVASYSAVDGRLQSLKATQRAGKVLQNLQYLHDPVGNIELIEDLAQPVQWFSQQRIEAVNAYTYDTLYQLISATGRESASQSIGSALPQLEIFGKPDDSRWRSYTQTYSYDSGGNLTDLEHDAGVGSTYHRRMEVAEHSNRALFKEDDDSVIDFTKGFDANGNQQSLIPGQGLQWDARNQLCQVTQVTREEPGGNDDDVEIYLYDGGGERVRKIRRAKTRGGEQINEVCYLPGLEIRTCTTGEHLLVVIARAGRSNVRLLHWVTGQRLNIENNQFRYSLADHLGSSTLELDQSADLISQESYYPFGGTAWWAARSSVDAKCKTIRYSGKERDATGLYYYGFRYYAPWFQRWVSADPAGDIDGLNMFNFVANQPVSRIDFNGLVGIDNDEKHHPSVDEMYSGLHNTIHAAHSPISPLEGQADSLSPHEGYATRQGESNVSSTGRLISKEINARGAVLKKLKGYRLNNLIKVYGDRLAIRPISFDVTMKEQTPAELDRVFELQRLGEEKYHFVSTSLNSSTKVPEAHGEFLYVIRKDDPLRVFTGATAGSDAFERDPGILVEGHTSLALRKDVLYAGTLIFKEGNLREWTNASGHYKPDAKLHTVNLLPPVKLLLPEAKFKMGFEKKSSKTTSFSWD